MNELTRKRLRRSPAEARAHILKSAEKVLLEQGASAIKVRVVAREAGMTDAGVTHHFENRDGLLKALMDEAARKVRHAVTEVVANWLDGEPDIAALVETIGRMYRDGYADLALQLHGSGWQDRGPVLLEPVIEPLLSINQNPVTGEAELRAALGALHLWLAVDPIFGDEFRRSVGLKARSDDRAQMNWWISTLDNMLKNQGRSYT